MAYSTGNPPLLLGTQPIAGPRQWLYWSSHTVAVTISSTHITDGQDLGIKTGDQFTNVRVNTSGATGVGLLSTAVTEITQHYVTRVAATSMNLTTGVVMSSAT